MGARCTRSELTFLSTLGRFTFAISSRSLLMVAPRPMASVAGTVGRAGERASDIDAAGHLHRVLSVHSNEPPRYNVRRCASKPTTFLPARLLSVGMLCGCTYSQSVHLPMHSCQLAHTCCCRDGWATPVAPSHRVGVWSPSGHLLIRVYTPIDPAPCTLHHPHSQALHTREGFPSWCCAVHDLAVLDQAS
jgi:hypothetical protein